KDIFDGDSKNAKTEEEKDINKEVTEEENQEEPAEKIYDISIVNTPSTITVNKDGKEQDVVVEIKNASNVALKKDELSVNIVGGVSTYAQYYHTSWLTQKRPALLDQIEIKPGESGAFSFLISLPTDVGEYNFQLQIVRQSGSQFTKIGKQFFDLKIVKTADEVMKEDKVEEGRVLGEKIYEEKQEETFVEKTKSIIKDIGDSIGDIIGDAVEIIQPFFYGGSGGGGGSSSPSVPKEKIEEVVEEIKIELPEISITDTSTMSWLTNIATTTIFGIKNSSTVAVYINEETSGLVYTTSTWQKETSLLEGPNTFEIFGQNEKGDKTPVISIEIILDSVSPTVPILNIEQINFVTPTLKINWFGTDDDTDVDNYDLEYNIGEDWIDILANSTSTDLEMDVEQGKTYDFRVRARDLAGNVSDWSGEDDNFYIIDWPKDVVINEVAWMGTSGIKNLANDCSKNEWVELYNNSPENIDLSAWSLDVVFNNGSIKTISLSGEIEHEGYYLLARKLGKTIKTLKNLEIGKFFESIDIPDDGGSLILKDGEGNIIDEASFDNGWPAGETIAGPNNNFHQPMARIFTTLPGSSSSNWETAKQLSAFGDTDKCGELFGSPSKKNNQLWLLKNPTFYYADLFQDNKLTLTKEYSPYVIDYQTEIPDGKILQIDPGVVLIGTDLSSYLRITGGLIANGTEEEPIVFTSARDTQYGDWNLPVFENMSNPNIPSSGDWSRIEVEDGGTAQIDNVQFLYGGHPFKKGTGWVYGLKILAQVFRVSSGNADISNSKFLYNSVYNSEPFYNSVIWIDVLNGQSSTVNLNNNIFDSGYTAINISEANSKFTIDANVTDNTIQNFSNPNGPLYISHSNPTLNNNIFSNNIFNGLSDDALLVEDVQTLDPSLSYIYSGIEITDSGELTIPAGTQLYLHNSTGIKNYGILYINGTVDSPVNITGHGGSWGKMIVDGGIFSANYLNITNGSGGSGMITLDNQSVATIENSQLIDSTRPGIVLKSTNSQLNLTNTTIGWSTPLPKNSPKSWHMYGIEMFAGNLNLDNIIFQEMTRGILGYNGATASMINMTSSSFVNISEMNWWPGGLVRSI
ncbi:hypothetical protein COY05_01990, partial [Candidatus Peregrinibacteria bacterium CG_4_10_14_0_2_um_filter_38_24]